MTSSVLILGATGVFGSRLVERAAREGGMELILAARDGDKLRALAARHCPEARIRPLDRDRITAADLAGADMVIDAAGPFQDSACQVIEAAIAARVHYVDLADGRDFVRNIARFDAAARAAGISVTSGASSIPALSHAVIDDLTESWRGIDTIKVGIFPGNRAPRGRAVVEAILSYAGKPVKVFMRGGWSRQWGWGGAHRWHIAGLGKRWASVCDTPEQDLLVARFKPARAAEFYAGAELSIMHLGLAMLAFPVRLGLIRSLRPAAGLLHWLTLRLSRFGSDVGAMEVLLNGTDAEGGPAKARWTLRADGNCGPYVPMIAAHIMIRRLRDGTMPPPGARACAGFMELREFDGDFDELGIVREIS